MNMAIWFVVAIAVATALMLGFRAQAKKAFFKARVPVELREIYSRVEARLSFETFSEVWGKVGDSFSIDPRLIYPADTFKAYSRFDSWDLGKGGDALEEWLKQLHLEPPSSVLTVLDLAVWMDSQKSARHV
jgi:hypothetical protein